MRCLLPSCLLRCGWLPSLADAATPPNPAPSPPLQPVWSDIVATAKLGHPVFAYTMLDNYDTEAISRIDDAMQWQTKSESAPMLLQTLHAGLLNIFNARSRCMVHPQPPNHHLSPIAQRKRHGHAGCHSPFF